MGVGAKVDLRHIVKIVIISGLLHYFFKTLDLLEDILVATVIGMMDSNWLFEGFLEILGLVQSGEVHVLEGWWGRKREKREWGREEKSGLEGNVRHESVGHQ